MTSRWPGHRCTRMGVRPSERCVFCQFAAQHRGVEIVPFDLRGAYDLTASEPYIVVRTVTRTRTRRSPQ